MEAEAVGADAQRLHGLRGERSNVPGRGAVLYGAGDIKQEALSWRPPQ